MVNCKMKTLKIIAIALMSIIFQLLVFQLFNKKKEIDICKDNKMVNNFYKNEFRDKFGFFPIDTLTFQKKIKNKVEFNNKESFKTIPIFKQCEYSCVFDSGTDIYQINEKSIIKIFYSFDFKDRPEILQELLDNNKTIPNSMGFLEVVDTYKILKKYNLINLKSDYFYTYSKDSLDNLIENSI